LIMVPRRVPKAWGRIRRAALLAAVTMALLGCESSNDKRSFDLGYGEDAPVYLDELSADQRDAAAASITAGLQRGTQSYTLRPGDHIEVLYKLNNRQLRPYRVAVGDELELDFQFDRSLNKTVVVRPDGVISLPGKGELRAIDTRPMDLAKDIGRRYVDIAQEPIVTVSVRKFTTPADELVDVVRTGTEGRARNAIVRPDGLIDLPLATGINAAGLTPADLQAQLDARYERTVGGVTTTVRVTGIAANQIFVFGEVKQPGAVPATSPRTLIQTIALAGGPLTTGALDQVRVLYFDPIGRPRLRRVNLELVMNELKIDQDMIVPPNSTVYVPPTALAKAGRFVDQVMRQIIQYNGISIGITPFYPKY